MKYSALIGNPTEHSVSHVMYAELAKAAGVDEFYQHIRVDVEAQRLGSAVGAFGELGFIGLNVTLPYKLDVMSKLDELDSTATELGAVNTIKLGSKTKGYNTDWAGIVESVKQFGGGRSLDTAVIFGTGGAARAAIYACRQLGAHTVQVLYREPESPATLDLVARQQELGVSVQTYQGVAEAVHGAQLVINTSSAGMVGKAAAPFELAKISDVNLEGKVFLDAVFKPLDTALSQHFRDRSGVTIDGLWMMIYQGLEALSIWLDRPVRVDQPALERLHDRLTRELQNV